LSRTSDRRYLRNRARIRDQDVCWICGQWIDPALKTPHPQSWTADHVDSYARTKNNYGPLAPAHKVCNERRGAGRKPKPETKHARDW
jgi:hypothetical protein